MVRILLVAALCATVSSTPQPRPGAVAGVVGDEVAILPGAMVTLTGSSTARTGITDGRGEYRIDKLTPGTYRVQVELQGFLPSISEDVTVIAGRTTWHDAELRIGPNTYSTHAESPMPPAIAGRVVDLAGGVLPGVTVTVTGPRNTKVVTDARGEYRLNDLLAGTYQLEAALPGFRKGIASVTAHSGRLTRSHLVLRLGVFTLVDYVMPAGVAEALREADVVAYVRVAGPVGVRLVNDAMIVTDHNATVVGVVKSDVPAIVPGSSLRFAQDSAGQWVEPGYRATGWETPYQAGESFLAFLTRGSDKSLGEYRGNAYMWRVKQGFVIPVNAVGALPAGLRSPMPVDEALAALRKLLTTKHP